MFHWGLSNENKAAFVWEMYDSYFVGKTVVSFINNKVLFLWDMFDFFFPGTFYSSDLQRSDFEWRENIWKIYLKRWSPNRSCCRVVFLLFNSGLNTPARDSGWLISFVPDVPCRWWFGEIVITGQLRRGGGQRFRRPQRARLAAPARQALHFRATLQTLEVAEEEEQRKVPGSLQRWGVSIDF